MVLLLRALPLSGSESTDYCKPTTGRGAGGSEYSSTLAALAAGIVLLIARDFQDPERTVVCIPGWRWVLNGCTLKVCIKVCIKVKKQKVSQRQVGRSHFRLVDISMKTATAKSDFSQSHLVFASDCYSDGGRERLHMISAYKNVFKRQKRNRFSNARSMGVDSFLLPLRAMLQQNRQFSLSVLSYSERWRSIRAVQHGKQV